MTRPGLVAVALVLLCAGTATAAAKPRTIELLEVSRSVTPTGGLALTEHAVPTPGQGLVIENDLYAWKGARRGSRVGTLQAVCVFTKRTATAAWVHCDGAALLRDGQIAFGGVIPQADVFRIPIVGGTGAYAGARGVVTVRSINETNSADSFRIVG